MVLTCKHACKKVNQAITLSFIFLRPQSHEKQANITIYTPHEDLKQILQFYSIVLYQPTTLGLHKAINHTIGLLPRVSLSNASLYHNLIIQSDEINMKIHDLLYKDFINPSIYP